MHDDAPEIRRRVSRLQRERLSDGHVIERRPLEVAAWVVQGEPVPAAVALAAPYVPIDPGASWGRPWGTTWLRLRGTVPSAWADDTVELRVDLGFNRHRAGFQSEGLLHDSTGVPVKAINPLNSHYTMAAPAAGGFEFYLEAASNPDFDIEEFEFVPTPLGDPETAGSAPLYRLGACELVRTDPRIWELTQDVRVLAELLDVLPADGTRAARILGAFEEMLHRIDPDDLPATVDAARDALAGVLSSPAAASAHRIVAIGHAHIDSAWLWPIRETIRKCARTFSNVLDLMDSDPDFTFACSSAQQYLWMQEHYPTIFERIRTRIAEGRWIPVGSMWVESDTNMPGGESLARQLIEGGEYFRDVLGVESAEVWLPDSFGYSGAFPQIAAAAGKLWMLTQKMSWNDTNPFPHHTFRWEGIDGSSLFTHLPPVDSYGAELTAAELAHAERNFKDKRHATISLVPYGYSDGGGGPTREMLASARRWRSLEGAPTVELGTPRGFFEQAQAELPAPAVWVGEMYLEGHRGTYTSQAETKRGNRRAEHLLREAEWWSTTAAVDVGLEYPAAALSDLWREVLLLQFHDILPGSSIAWVHHDAEAAYSRIADDLERIIESALTALTGEGDRELVVNSSPFARAGIEGGGIGESRDGAAPAVTSTASGTRIDNGLVAVIVDERGLVVSLSAAGARDAVPPGRPLGLLQLHRDSPSQWDAWDIEQHYRGHVVDLDGVVEQDIRTDGDVSEVVTTRREGDSTYRQVVRVRRDSGSIELDVDVDWHERDRLLKLALPFDVRADDAVSETQFGHVRRSTHANTSWDDARFETVAHRWVHVGEPGFGVAVANDATYGYDISRETGTAGRAVTTVRASLLRGPRYPDPDADLGTHSFGFTVRPSAGIPEAVADGYAVNLRERRRRGSRAVRPLVEADGAVIESLTLARDGSRDVIVRLYEPHGRSAEAEIRWRFADAGASAVDLLERTVRPARLSPLPGGVRVSLRPFELVTLRVARGVQLT